MKLIGLPINLTISEPWDSSKVVEAIILKQFLHGEKNYLLVKNVHATEKFIVSNRYIGDEITEIIHGKKLIVSIALPEADTFTFNDDFYTHINYFGIGSIEMA
jgi:hypothetical protein